QRCLVYHSSKDPVLKIGYRIGALDRALGYKGPENPDIIEQKCPEVFVVDCSAVVASHGGYRSAGEGYDHSARVLDDETLPCFEKLKKEHRSGVERYRTAPTVGQTWRMSGFDSNFADSTRRRPLTGQTLLCPT